VIQRIVLRMAMLFLAITTGTTLLSLLVGHFMPADMLSAVTQHIPYEYQKATFALIDLNRHLRTNMTISVPEGILQITINQSGQEALIITQGIDTRVHLYHYHLLADALRELSTTYPDLDTGYALSIDSFPQWSPDNTTLWHYDSGLGVVYRLDLANNIWQRLITFPENYTRALQTFQPNNQISISLDQTQMAVVSRDTIYVFNSDGTHLRQYARPVEAVFVYLTWSPEGQQLYIYSYSGLSSTLADFRILDLNSGEINSYSSSLEGYIFSRCPQDAAWWVYVDTEQHGQVFNAQTGESQNLNLLPELADQSIQRLSWTPDCAWVVVTIGNPNDNNMPGLAHRRMYLVSRNTELVYLLTESGGILSWIDNDSLLLTEAQPNGSDLSYEVNFNNTFEKAPTDHFVPVGDFIIPLRNDPYRLLIYDFGTTMQSVDVRSGSVVTYQAANETILQFYLWRWDN
jgi:hypothetical protein